ncbi:MAG: GGDEF domain-containing protein [Schwartzia sp. (in: firmicutes)]
MGDTMHKVLKQALLLSVIVAVVGTFLGMQQAAYVRTRKEKAELIALSAAAQLEERINREIYLTTLFDILIRANEEEPFSAFHETVTALLRANPQGLFKGAVAMAEDSLTNRPFRTLSALSGDGEGETAIESRVMSGSIGFKQKGGELIAYHPVYNKAGEILGFSMRPVHLADLFQNTRSFKEITENNYCTLAVLAGADSQMIYSNLGGFVDFEPVRTEIRLANGAVWVMTLMPKEGWISFGKRWVNGILAGVIILFLYRLLSNLGQIKRQLLIKEHMASVDALTDTLNKRAFKEKVGELDRGIEPYGLIFLDLDQFKEINDQYGHDAGDQVLSETARRLKAAMRDVDKVYRVGGDEFVILTVGGLSVEAYAEVRTRIKADVEGTPVIVGLRPLFIRVSMGYAGRPADGTTTCEVLKVADQRMYEDKQKNHSRRRGEEGAIQTVSG